MKLLNELQADRAHKVKSAQDLIEKAENEDRVLNDDEEKTVATLMAEAEELESLIEKRKAHDAQSAKVKEAIAKINKPEERKTSPETPGTPIEVRLPELEMPVYSKLQAFKGPHAKENAYRCGMALRAALFQDENARGWCNRNGMEFRVLAEGTNTLGGFLVPEEMNQAIIDLREEYGIFRQECDVVPMGSDTITVPRRIGGVTAAFVGESGTIAASDPTWDQVRLVAKKLAVLTRMSSEVSADAVINLADWIAKEIAYAFALMEDTVGFAGQGTAAHGGILGVATAFNNNNNLIGAVDNVTTNAAAAGSLFSDIDNIGLTTLMGTLPQYAHKNAKWYCSQTCADQALGRLQATAGGNTIQSLSGSFTPSYLGYPIVITQALPTLSTTANNNETLMLFGDLRLAASLGDRRGVSLKVSEDRYLELDQIAIRGIERFDINVHDVGTTGAAGPIVALIGTTQ